MSVKLMAEVWSLQLPAEQQQILLALADHAHDDGSKCHPGIRYLAWKTGKSESSVQRILGRLRHDGLIEPVAYFQGGRGHATEYRLILSKGLKKLPFISDASEERVSPVEERVSPVEERVSPVQLKGPTGGTPTILTIKEPSIEPSFAGRSKRPPKIREPISEPQKEKLVAEFADQLRGAEVVRQTIEEALNHEAVRKYQSEYLYVRGWLRRDAERLEARSNGRAGAHPGQSQTPHPESGSRGRGVFAKFI